MKTTGLPGNRTDIGRCNRSGAIELCSTITVCSRIWNFEDSISVTILSRTRISVTFLSFATTSSGNRSCRSRTAAILVISTNSATIISHDLIRVRVSKAYICNARAGLRAATPLGQRRYFGLPGPSLSRAAPSQLHEWQPFITLDSIASGWYKPRQRCG